MAELYKSVTELMKTARGNKALQNKLGDITDFQEIIDDAPTADVVEVVRCKDCKYCIKIDKPRTITYPDLTHRTYFLRCRVFNNFCDKDAFCSGGERRDT